MKRCYLGLSKSGDPLFWYEGVTLCNTARPHPPRCDVSPAALRQLGSPHRGIPGIRGTLLVAVRKATSASVFISTDAARLWLHINGSYGRGRRMTAATVAVR